MTQFKAGDRVARKADKSRVGTLIRKHEVQGAWYVSFNNVEQGHYDYNLVLVASDPFEDSVYAYIQKELAI